jgi:hypothetical protein
MVAGVTTTIINGMVAAVTTTLINWMVDSSCNSS